MQSKSNLNKPEITKKSYIPNGAKADTGALAAAPGGSTIADGAKADSGWQHCAA